MLRHANGSRRSTFESFEANMKQMEETNKILTSIENKLSDYVNTSLVEQRKPLSQATPRQSGTFSHSLGRKSDIENSQVESYKEHLQRNDYDIRSSIQDRDSHIQDPSTAQRNSAESSQSKRSTKGNQDSEFQEYDISTHDKHYVEETINEMSEHNRTTSEKQSRKHVATGGFPTKNFVLDKEQYDKREDTYLGRIRELQNDQRSQGRMFANSQTKQQNQTAQLENFYTNNKIQVLEERVRSNEKEIHELRRTNGDLRLEVARLKGELSRYSQAQPQDIWERFKEEKISLVEKGLGGNSKKEKLSHGHSKQFEQNLSKTKDTYINNVEDKLHVGGELGGGSSRTLEFSKSLNLKKTEQSHTYVAYEPQSLSHYQSESVKINVMDDEKLGFMFNLINKYKQEVDLLKENNILIQQQLKQEIKHLKKDLDSQRIHNKELANVLQYERSVSQQLQTEKEQLETAKSFEIIPLKNKIQSFEEMSKDDLTKLARSLQDSYMILEEQHMNQVKQNQVLQTELILLNEKNKQEFQQFNEAYHKIFDERQINNINIPPKIPVHEQVYVQTEETEDFKKYQKNNEGSPPVKEKKSFKNTPLHGREILRETLRNELRNISVISPEKNNHEINSSYYQLTKSNHISFVKTLDERKMTKKKLLNKSMEKFDNFVEQLNKVRKVVEGKIAEKDVVVSTEQSMDPIPLTNEKISHLSKEMKKNKGRSVSRGKTTSLRNS